MLALFGAGFSNIFHVQPLLLLFLGVIAGIIFGATPGLTTSMGLVLMLPMTYAMSLVNSLALLLGLYIGGVSGGLITAILLNIPGTPASVPTTFDGAPMARNGQPGRALSLGIIASFLGGMVSFVFLFFFSPIISAAAVKFSAIEYTSISVFALMLVSSLAGKSMVKGMMAALIGMAFATVGLAPLDSAKRYTFGTDALNNGFALVAVLIGVYAVIEVLNLAEGNGEKKLQKVSYKRKGFEITAGDFRENAAAFAISALIGSGIGFLPGIGSGTGSMLAYSVVKNRSKNPEAFGTGISQGIVASETANNAVIGGALIPLLTLGIPGDSSTAILLSSFMLHGVTTGPLLFSSKPDLIYTMFMCLLIGNVMMLVIEYFGISVFLKILAVPKHILFPVIMVLCAIGAFGINNRTFDVCTIIIFALVGYAFKKLKYPIAPFILGFILEPIVEKNLMRALQLTKGSFLPFLTRPVSCVFLLVIAVYLFFVIKGRLKATIS